MPDSLNLDIEFLYFLGEVEMSKLVKKYKKVGYLIKVYMTDVFAGQEGPEMYGMLHRAGVDTIITDSVDRVHQFNSSN